ncbi:MAG TPA: YdeI/OmpD-associated family protein [Chitinophagaceae bacterium]|nr:YdeI/OmpD-associated family protein [Chitinophagaceae bacterium]
MNPNVDWFFEKKTKWQTAYQVLREIVLSTHVVEELKWGCPCYTFNKANVVLIHGFKDYCALLFMKGAIMKDPKNLLIQQTENVQSSRQIRFTHVDEIRQQKTIIKAYVKEAIAIEKAGLSVELKKTTEYKIPEEFEAALQEMEELKIAFNSLTPGRQRAYLLYFSSAKQAKTRNERIEKYIPQILDGKGLHDE